MISDSTVAHLAGSFPSQGLSGAHAIVKHLTDSKVQRRWKASVLSVV